MNNQHAAELACNYSLVYPGQRFYIIWDAYEGYIVTTDSSDRDFRDYYLNGEYIYGDEHDHKH